MNTITLLVFLLVYSIIMALLIILPRMSGRKKCFGITIPEENEAIQSVKLIYGVYRTSILMFGGVFLLFTLAVAFTTPSDIALIFAIGGTFIQIGASMVFYMLGRRKMHIIAKKST